MKEEEAREVPAEPFEATASLHGVDLEADGGSSISRRRFLGLLSASAALAGASCSRIDRGSIVPYTRKPVEVIPGIATYYASTFPEGLSAHGVLVKTREGRPIHVEGNPEGTGARGKAPLRAIADLLGLYDPDRLRKPTLAGKTSTWPEALGALLKILREARGAGKPVLLLTGASVSPARKALIGDLKKALPILRHVSWEPAEGGSEAAAARAVFGEHRIPARRFDRADVIVSLGCDFLGIESRPAEVLDFASRRRPESGKAAGESPPPRLWVLEGPLTLTGASADHRFAVRPSRLAAVAFALARTLATAGGKTLPSGLAAGALEPFDLDAVARDLGLRADLLKEMAADLARAGSRSLVLAGAALPPEAHAAAHLLSAMLGAEGSTVDASLAAPPPEILTPAEFWGLLEEAVRDAFAAAIFWGPNPAYAWPDLAGWKAAAAKIPFKARIALHEDETALECDAVLPESHWLESWGDHEPSLDVLSLQQPCIGPLHDSRQGEDVLLEAVRALGGQAPATYREYLMERWRRDVYPQGSPAPFERFWSAALHDGLYRREAAPRPPRAAKGEEIAKAAARAAVPSDSGMFELVLAPAYTVHDGRYGTNGWLQELPDPLTRLTWGNHLAFSRKDLQEKLSAREGDLVTVEAGKAKIEVPVISVPGTAPGVASLALGYGRRTGVVPRGIGANSFVLVDPAAPAPFLRPVAVRSTGKSVKLPFVQLHHTLDGRDAVRSLDAGDYAKGVHWHRHALHSLYPEGEFRDNKWGLAIDLSACTGCGACIVACQSENNVPVVGPEQVYIGREMHWIRVDRYFEGAPEDPEVRFQPMLCQQCDNAPCENVCPVNATTHSHDGLNQMAYNRCVGTRYCANNCPYKVRRFNFFEWSGKKEAPETLAFNPEVTVRPRGVMEKCTFCIQRIQDGRMRAKAEGRPLRDGDIRPACAVACPAGAIVFGDLLDRASGISRLAASDRGYKVLEDLGIRPAVTYLAGVRNPPAGAPRKSGAAHGGPAPAGGTAREDSHGK